MTLFQWRRFNFFDISKDVDKGSLSEKLKDVDVTCTSSGRGHIVIGDSDGHLHIVNRQFQVSTQKAFDERVDLVVQLKHSKILIAVGHDDPGLQPFLKVYNADKQDKQGSPLGALARITRIQVGSAATKPTALAVHENQNLLAIGCANGQLILYRGEVTKDRGTKQKVIHEAGAAISGLAFRNSGKAIYLYVASESNVVCYNVTVKDKEIKYALDNFGCKKGLAVEAITLQDTHFIMGCHDAVYCYTPESRGQCYAFEGEKVCLYWYRNYLVLVTRDPSDKHTLTIFDVLNKFIAFTAPLKSIQALVSEWGVLFALTSDNKLIEFVEKDTQSKLQLLFKKNFYDIAIKIAKTQHYDSDGLIDIFRQYGDHLYSKGDHNGAIENYVKTIGHLEPSYVIRKFLDAHKIHFLTAYLQALHREGLANEDHTTLLLNCYTKLKDNKKLDEFINAKDLREVDFDVEIAIKVCRQAGYFRHALSLAKNQKQHEWYLRIQLEDQKDYRDALNYISLLDFDAAEHNMRKYGSVLIHKLPKETTDFLIKLCSDYRPGDAPLVSEDMLQGAEHKRQAAQPEDFLHLFVKNSVNMVEFLEHMIQVRSSDSSQTVYNTILEHYLSQWSNTKDSAIQKKQEEKVMKVLKNTTANYDCDQALILCQLHNFRAGTLYLYEKKNLYGQILKYYIEFGDVDSAIMTCRKFGAQDPQIWTQLLQNIAIDGSAEPEHITEVLDMIEKLRQMSPLMVVKTMADSPLASLGLVRDYLIRVLQAEDRQTDQDMKLIDQYRVDTKKVRQSNEELRNAPSVFQGTKCNACNHSLEHPSIHFLCRHSYHQHCFQSYSESETECPVCTPENKKIVDIIKSQQQSREQHDAFHHQLEKAEDGFTVVAEYFGRGMFTRATSVAPPPTPTAPARTEELATSLSDEIYKQPQSEARMRAEVKPAKPQFESEGRMRSTPQEVKSFVISEPSESRLRSTGLNRLGSPEARLGSSLEAHLTREPRTPPRRTPAIPDVPKKEDIPAKEYNPFDSPERDQNPFDSGDKNPFEETAETTNPFGEDDDYDDSLNPFAS